MEIPRALSLCSEGINPLKVDLLNRCLVPGSCLDVGCGNGGYGPHILRICSKILQVDVEDRRREDFRALPFVSMDAQTLDLPGPRFENVVAFDIMEHLDDDVDFLRRVKRVGCQCLILSVPNSDDEQLRPLQVTHMHHIDKTHRRAYTSDALRAVLTAAGFRVRLLNPHFNPALLAFADVLARPGSIAARVAARTIYLQSRFYERIGLFENRCVADWFCCATPVDSL